MKRDLVKAPVLSLPDIRKPFQLFINVENGTAYGVLTQGWAGQRKPVGYYSKILDPVSRRWLPCLQALVATALLVEEVGKVTLGGELKQVCSCVCCSLLLRGCFPNCFISSLR